MIPCAFKKADGVAGQEKGKITAAVWQDLGRQQRVEWARGEAGVQAKKVKGEGGAGSAVLLRALKERAGGYKHGGGS